MSESLQFSLKQREAIVGSLGRAAGSAADFVFRLESLENLQQKSFVDLIGRLSSKLPQIPEGIERLKTQAAEADKSNRAQAEEIMRSFRNVMLDEIKLVTGERLHDIRIKYYDKDGRPQEYIYTDGTESAKSMSVDLTGFELF